MSDEDGELGEVYVRVAEFVWKVENFSSLSQTVNYEFFSPDFHFLDRDWYFKMFPNGNSFDISEGYVVLYLFLRQQQDDPISFRYSVGIQAADGQTQVWSSGTHTSCEKSDCLLVKLKGILRSDLLRRRDELLPRDVLTVTATLKEGGADEKGTKEVSVQTEVELKIAEVSTQTKDNNGSDKVLQDIRELWVSGKISDVVFKVKDDEFKAHRNILAIRTPVLCAMFQHDTAEKASGEVTIDDCEPAVFEQLLHYIYTGAPRELNAENAVALYVLADKYLVNEVKALCVRCMKDELCLDTFCDYAELSLMYKEAELLDMAVDFFSRNMIDVVKTVEWQRFLGEHLTWGNEMLIRALELTKGRDGDNTRLCKFVKCQCRLNIDVVSHSSRQSYNEPISKNIGNK